MPPDIFFFFLVYALKLSQGRQKTSSPVKLLSLPLIQLCDDVGEGAINPGNNHCKADSKLF